MGRLKHSLLECGQHPNLGDHFKAATGDLNLSPIRDIQEAECLARSAGFIRLESSRTSSKDRAAGA